MNSLDGNVFKKLILSFFFLLTFSAKSFPDSANLCTNRPELDRGFPWWKIRINFFRLLMIKVSILRHNEFQISRLFKLKSQNVHSLRNSNQRLLSVYNELKILCWIGRNSPQFSKIYVNEWFLYITTEYSSSEQWIEKHLAANKNKHILMDHFTLQSQFNVEQHFVVQSCRGKLLYFSLLLLDFWPRILLLG